MTKCSILPYFEQQIFWYHNRSNQCHPLEFWPHLGLFSCLFLEKRAIWRMSWPLHKEMTSFVIFLCLVFIIRRHQHHLEGGNEGGKLSLQVSSSSWEVIWGNQWGPLSLFQFSIYLLPKQIRIIIMRRARVLFGTRIT